MMSANCILFFFVVVVVVVILILNSVSCFCMSFVYFVYFVRRCTNEKGGLFHNFKEYTAENRIKNKHTDKMLNFWVAKGKHPE